MEDNKLIDGAEYISLEDAKRLKLPYFDGRAAGYPCNGGTVLLLYRKSRLSFVQV